jgi:hypothetical protein
MEDHKIYTQALEADRSGNWDKAHELVQDLNASEAAWIHAYLHRKEGDLWNADYWYRRAGKPSFKGTLEEEWDLLNTFFNKTN